MGNRRLSVRLQILTGIMLGAAWLLTKALRKNDDAGNSSSPASPYYPIRYQRGVMLSLLLFIADLYAIPAVLRGKPEIGTAELLALHPAQIRLPDRIALELDPEDRNRIRRCSDKVLMGIIVLPLILLTNRRIRGNAANVGILYVWLHAVTYTLYSYSPLGPAFIDKYRPVVYYPSVPGEDRKRGNNRNACYSGHTGNATCASFFMAKVFHDYHPGLSRSAGYGLYLLACIPPLLLGCLRIRALKHFPSDVLLAIFVGGSCGVIVPQTNKQMSCDTND
jgi:hypothetical protein